MIIFETSIFTKKINTLLSDEEYRSFQNYLIEVPTSGNIIIGSGGIRKIRWKGKGHGKRGGTRVIYFWEKSKEQIFMLYGYAKNESENLSKEQLAILKQIVTVEFKNEK
jgi:hypothetical protein